MECNTVKCIASLRNVVSRPRTSKIFLLTELQCAVLCPSYFDQTVSTTKYFALRAVCIILCAVFLPFPLLSLFAISIIVNEDQSGISSMILVFVSGRQRKLLFLKHNVCESKYSVNWIQVCKYLSFLWHWMVCIGVDYVLFSKYSIALHCTVVYILHCDVMHCIVLYILQSPIKANHPEVQFRQLLCSSCYSWQKVAGLANTFCPVLAPNRLKRKWVEI